MNLRGMRALCLFLLITISYSAVAQRATCYNRTTEHSVYSSHLGESRNYWVSLPLRYSDTIKYPVIYVLDAEWRFDLIKHIAFELGMHDKITRSIIIGIPHLDWETKRSMDLTFSHSCTEYDGHYVDSSWYNSSNSGGAMAFYQFITQELMPAIDAQFHTNGHETLIGHSLGGYFGGYILSLDHPFEVIHMYDPSLWYNDGEVATLFKQVQTHQPVIVYLTYQPEPANHGTKVRELIKLMESSPNIEVQSHCYERECHNSLFLDSFYRGIQFTNPGRFQSDQQSSTSGLE